MINTTGTAMNVLCLDRSLAWAPSAGSKLGTSGRGGNHFALSGKNAHPHIQHHDGSKQCTDVDVSCSGAEKVYQRVRNRCRHDERKYREACFKPAQCRAQRQIVDEPAENQCTDSDGDALALRNVSDIVDRSVHC